MKRIYKIIFWSLVVVVLTLAFGFSSHTYLYSFYFVSFLLPVIVATSFFYNHFLIPRYLLKKRYLKFALYGVYALIISMYLEMMVIFLAYMILANYQYNNMIPVTTNIFILAVILYLIVLVNAFILLVKTYFSNQEHLNRLKTEKDKLSKGYILVKSGRQNARILFDEIEYIESLGDYVKINTSSGKKIITREKISKLQKKLPEDFLRIHRSFLVNRNKIKAYSKGHITLEDTVLPVSRTYKHAIDHKI